MKQKSKFLQFLQTGAMLIGATAFAGTGSLLNFFDAVSEEIDDTLHYGIYMETRYDDNYHSNPKGDEKDAGILEIGVNGDLYKNIGDSTYGLRGKIGYEWYSRDASDENSFDWSLTPHIGGAIGDNYLKWRITMDSEYHRDRLNSADTRYAKQYTTSVGSTLEYSRHPRWGAALTLDYIWTYYPQKEFKSYSNQKVELGASAYYKFTDKVKFGPRISWETTKYRNDDTNDDSDLIRLNAVLDYRMNRFFNVGLEAGVVKKYYDGYSKKSKDDREFAPDLCLNIKYLPVRNMGFLLQSYVESGDSQAARSLNRSYGSTLVMNWMATSKLLFSQSTGISWQDEKETDTDTREWFYRLTVDYKLRPHFNVYGGYEYKTVKYLYRGKRDYDDNIVRLGVKWGM